MSDQLLLDIALYNTLQSFYLVQLRTVGRQKHEFEVQVCRKLRHIFRVVARVIVKNNVNFLVGIDKLLAQQRQKLQDTFLVGRHCLHKHCFLHARTDGPKDCDSLAAEFRIGPLYRVIRRSPSSGVAHPHVKR